MSKTTVGICAAASIGLAALPAAAPAARHKRHGGPKPTAYRCTLDSQPADGFRLLHKHRYRADSGGVGDYAVEKHRFRFRSGPFQGFTGSWKKTGLTYYIYLQDANDPETRDTCRS
jgi:hypothetical protein